MNLVEKLESEIKDGGLILPAHDVEPLLRWIRRLQRIEGCHCPTCSSKFWVVFDEVPEQQS